MANNKVDFEICNHKGYEFENKVRELNIGVESYIVDPGGDGTDYCTINFDDDSSILFLIKYIMNMSDNVRIMIR